MRIVFTDFPEKFISNVAVPDALGSMIEAPRLACEFVDLEEFILAIEKVAEEIQEQWPEEVARAHGQFA